MIRKSGYRFSDKVMLYQSLFAGILMAQASTATIYVLNGPNLNLLGTREPAIYGHATLADVEKLCAETAAEFGLHADCRQSNREGELIDFIHEARTNNVAGIVINAGGYSHTSIALHDAIVGVQIPAVEVHVTNIHARESFRHHSFTAKAAFASLCGFGIDGYRLAIAGLAAKIGAKAIGAKAKA
jgi:3-dehydroquinate dehydratase II